MDTYWKLISKALRNDNLEELQCLLTGYKDDTFKFQIENCFKLPENINRSFQDKRSIISKDMCYVNMLPVVNDYDENEETTLLHLAVSQYAPEAVWLLLQHGANPNTFQFKPFGTTLLFTLIKLESLCDKYKSKFCDSKLKDVINLLIEFDADLYNLTPDGLTFLHVAVTKEYDIFTELFEIISSQTCFNINYPIPGNSLHYMNEYNFNYSEGDTALHVLTKRHSGASQICKVLFKHGMNLNARNTDGCSALHYALRIRIFYNFYQSSWMNQHLFYIQFLLEHGARLDVLDCNKESPMVYYYTNVKNRQFFKPDARSFENGKVHMKGRMEILWMLKSGGAMTRSALKEVSSLNLDLRANFEYMILTFYTHTWLFETLVDVRYPFLFLNKMSKFYKLYSIPQSLKRLSAMVLYSSLKPNVLCGIQKLLVPASIRDYVTLGNMEIFGTRTWEPIYSDKHWQDLS